LIGPWGRLSEAAGRGSSQAQTYSPLHDTLHAFPSTVLILQGSICDDKICHPSKPDYLSFSLGAIGRGHCGQKKSAAGIARRALVAG